MRSLLIVALGIVCLVVPALSAGEYIGHPAPLGPDGAPIVNPNPGKKLPDPPPSPYISRELGCVKGDPVTKRGTPVIGDYVAFPPSASSPFSWDHLVFKMEYKLPPFAQSKLSTCRGPSCMDVYEMDLYEVKVDLGCPGGLTPVLTYNGSFPGPTFYPLAGRQSMVRINNKMYIDQISYGAQHPCDHGSHIGRPASFHHHGGNTLAPYDGWAEDVICPGQSKDYVLADEIPGFLWYHDHTLDYTTEMVYYGLAGLWLVHNSKSAGGCGEPWNLEGIQTLYLAFGDKTFNEDCTLYYNRPDQFLWGDVNIVSGVPWPLIKTTATWTQIQLLAGSNERSWMIRIVDDYGVDVSSKICRVIGGDNGYARVPLNIPPTGIFMGSGERYIMICNFENLEGKTLYVWNEFDPIRMPRENYFCYSHLIAKIVFDVKTPVDPVKFKFNGPIRTNVDNWLDPDSIALAQKMSNEGKCHRTFLFGHDANFKWLINGETWFTVRIAADDVGQNTWELWCLQTEPFIHHPIHMHMVAGIVISRNGTLQGLEPYEIYQPKDVFEMYPETPMTVMMRFGPHHGEWMFHCHITKHEDEVMMRTYIIDEKKALNPAGAFPYTKLLKTVNPAYEDLQYPYSRPPVDIKDQLPLAVAMEKKMDERGYRIFYPDPALDEPDLFDTEKNPWRFECPDRAAPNTQANINKAIAPYGKAAVSCMWGVNGTCGSYKPLPPIGTPIAPLPKS